MRKIAYLGFFSDIHSDFLSFSRSPQILFDKGELDLAKPYLYLCFHSMELGIKAAIYDLYAGILMKDGQSESEFGTDEFENKIMEVCIPLFKTIGHNLSTGIVKLEEVLVLYKKKFEIENSSDRKVVWEAWESSFEFTKRFVAEISRFPSNGESLRYSVNKKGDVFFDGKEEPVDIEDLHMNYNNGLNALNGISLRVNEDLKEAD